MGIGAIESLIFWYHCDYCGICGADLGWSARCLSGRSHVVPFLFYVEELI